MSHSASEDAVLAARVREWLLALLRFAATSDEADRAALLARAAQMDRGSAHFDAPAFSYFSRTSAEICAAILARDTPESGAVLRRQFKRIDDDRLRGALEAVVGLDRAPATRDTRPNGRDDLWKGLEKAGAGPRKW